MSLLIIALNFVIGYSLAKYTTKKDGNLSFSVAKPVIEATIDSASLYISNYKQKPFYFSVCNFDKNDNISGTAMSYSINIETSQDNAPLHYKLYRIYSDNSEKALDLTINGSIIGIRNPINIYSNNKEIHNYRLDIEYEKSSKIKLDTNFSVSLTIKGEQIKI